MKHTEIIHTGEAVCKGNFLQHITELIHHEILPEETFAEHFTRLQEKFKDSPEKLAAITEWIEEQSPEIMPQVIWDAYEYPENPDCTLYHVFNMFNAV